MGVHPIALWSCPRHVVDGPGPSPGPSCGCSSSRATIQIVRTRVRVAGRVTPVVEVYVDRSSPTGRIRCRTFLASVRPIRAATTCECIVLGTPILEHPITTRRATTPCVDVHINVRRARTGPRSRFLSPPAMDGCVSASWTMRIVGLLLVATRSRPDGRG